MKVFFAIDGSEESFAAVRQVGQLLSPATDAVALFFAPPEVVVKYTEIADELRAQALDSIAGSIFDRARPLLPESLSAGAKLIVAQHSPRYGILIEAENWGADLIVVGARGMSAVQRFLLGSVSQGVVQNSRIPVLVSRPRAQHREGPTFRVLFAYDGSEHSQAALAAAGQLTFPAHSAAIAMTVVEALPADLPHWIHYTRSADTLAMIEVWRKGVERDKQQAREAMGKALSHSKAPFSQAELVVTEGHPAEQILELVEAREIDLVIVGSQGKGALDRLLIGSTSLKVLAHAPCSVLIVPTTRQQ